MTLAQLKTLDAGNGAKIPTLLELMALLVRRSESLPPRGKVSPVRTLVTDEGHSSKDLSRRAFSNIVYHLISQLTLTASPRGEAFSHRNDRAIN